MSEAGGGVAGSESDGSGEAVGTDGGEVSSGDVGSGGGDGGVVSSGGGGGGGGTTVGGATV